MNIVTLEDLYLDQIRDNHSANSLALTMTEELARTATDADLVQALTFAAADIQKGIEALEGITRRHDESPVGAKCAGMEALIHDAREKAVRYAFAEQDTENAMIFIHYQRLGSFMLAGYDCLAAFARRLELCEDADALTLRLDQTYAAHRFMIELASGKINGRVLN